MEADIFMSSTLMRLIVVWWLALMLDSSGSGAR